MKSQKQWLPLCVAALLATLCLFAFPTQVSAATEGVYTYSVSGGKATITDCNTSISGDVTIPSTLGGYPVTNIGSYAFSYCTSLTGITIPDSVQSIGEQAFRGCTSLTSITIPDSVTSIGNSAFYDCTSLQYNTYDNAKYLGNTQNPYLVLIETTSDTITSCDIHPNTKIICGYAFSYCNSLTSITIPDSMTFIGDSAFYGCTSLADVYITDPNAWCKFSFASSYSNPMIYGACLHILDSDGNEATEVVLDSTVTVIPARAFAYCTGLTSVTLGSSVESIGWEAFYDCTSLTSVTIPDSVSSIGTRAFYGCSSLKSIAIPDRVKFINDESFMYCVSLEEVSMGNSVGWISQNAFRNCSNLKSLVLSDVTEKVYSYAFSGCTALSAVTIPDTVTKIDEWAFYNCKNMDHVMYGGTQNEQKKMRIDGTNDTLLTATWHCGVDETSLHVSSKTLCSAVALYDCDVCQATCYKAKETAEHNFVNGKCTSCSLPEDSPWHYAINGTGVEITGCDAAVGTKPRIPETIEGLPVTAIGNRALQSLKDITSISIPETVESIGYSAFRDCSQLLDIYFAGSQEQWEEILVDSNNAPLLDALMHYLSKLLLGDIDGNDDVTSDDVIQLLLHISMPQLFPIDAEADFTGDGEVTSDDVIRLLLHISMPELFPLGTA